MKSEKQQQILSCMADILNQNGFRAQMFDKTEQAPLFLRAEQSRVGKVGQDIAYECCFIPLALPNDDTGLLQFYVTLFQNVPQANGKAVREACEYCNDFCALGSFRYFAQGGQIYLKHNALLAGSDELLKIVTYIADNISLLSASVARFVDGLAACAFTGTPLEAAIEQGLFPKM